MKLRATVAVSSLDLRSTAAVTSVAHSHTLQARNCSVRKRDDQPQKKKFQIRRDLDESDNEDVNCIEDVNGIIETYPNRDHVYIDTCASAGLFILSDSIHFSSISKIDGVIGLTAAGLKMVLA